jgi:membrane protein implicated in regulation of membrane protease activity
VFELPTADLVFLLCALIGGFLLLITVVLDDILGGALDFLDLDLGGSSLMPLILSFVAMFGIGGLFGTQVLELSSGMASIVGVGFGMVGAALAWAMFRFLRNSVSPPPFSQQDLVGTEAYVTVAIPKTRWGTISMKVEGQTHEFRATSAVDIPRGEVVRISGVAGTGLIVEHGKVPADQAEVATGSSAEGAED